MNPKPTPRYSSVTSTMWDSAGADDASGGLVELLCSLGRWMIRPVVGLGEFIVCDSFYRPCWRIRTLLGKPGENGFRPRARRKSVFCTCRVFEGASAAARIVPNLVSEPAALSPPKCPLREHHLWLCRQFRCSVHLRAGVRLRSPNLRFHHVSVIRTPISFLCGAPNRSLAHDPSQCRSRWAGAARSRFFGFPEPKSPIRSLR